ncbi:hypothetical protein [Streptomyces sp. SBT349]|uniref:phage tail tube protein n=1 Tax=Streptomyces sp. SBT349 TaxID=1580539 RepID=UPI0007C76DD8|nr:hypothetical protein [Streptomyces sp. SBT349]
MALVASEVDVAITGEMFSAPVGTTAPTNASAPLDPAFIGHGYCSEDGVTEAWEDNVENIVAWQNATVVRAARTESLVTFQTTLIQNRGSNLELYHPGSTMETDGGSGWMLEVKPANSDPRSFVINVVDGNTLMRFYLGNAEVTERGEIQYANGQAIGYQVTITAYPDADGNLMVKYSTDAAWGTDIAGGS